MISEARSDHPVLVFGATGRHGNTGEHLVRRLREQGQAVRVLARSLGERTERLEELGAEVVVGDLHDRRTLVPALADVDRVFFTYPIDDGIVDAAANYAAAAGEVGRRPRTVVMSMGPAHPKSPSHLGRAQWLAEQVLEWAGIDLLILRVVALFHENILVLHANSVRDEGMIRNSFGAGRIGWISGCDAAELGVSALQHPERFDAPVANIAGSEDFNHTEIAGLLGDLTGRPVDYRAVTRDDWRDELMALAHSSRGVVVNNAMAQHISAVGQMVSANGASVVADGDRLCELIGREPLSLREFLGANVACFIHP
ncbi:uncharacterized protein YbjT (DUF2867 family) [Mycobacterium frederiksbergense]|uniref:Uncharacterized protein YbjT (DUF2867 family) n=1 Tax=Mycolicibacterium frederiksbergense TaxID=117567 RepID=A0ABT6L143_9MYCO|nr:NmrA family NAD(P)-binding protein [Mycolicibacterium frederiksbergense]MDH6196664.1 uncharacterized protein YbjT (DUF2867 family) [Mycolicibacterium frederiksbergense]